MTTSTATQMRATMVASKFASAWLVVLGFALPAWAATTCASVFSPHAHLTRAQAKAILGLNAGDYKTNVQRIEVGGRERLVVFVGEAHIKTPEDSARFSQIIEQFEFHGLEGVNMKNYWLSKKMSKSVDWKPNKKQTDGSSINATRVAEAIATYKVGLIEIIEERIRSGKESRESIVAAIESGEFNLHDYIAHETEGVSTELGELIEQAIASFDPRSIKEILLSKSVVRKIQKFPLENTRKPTFHEQVKALAWLASFKVYRKSYCRAAACALSVGLFSLAPDWKYALLGAGYGYLAPMIGAASLRLYGMGFMAIDARDDHMSKTLLKVLEENPSVDKIVVTVGQLHVRGLVRRLQTAGSSTEPLTP